jgi:hypothetical protein
MKKRTMQLAVLAVFIGVSILPAQAAVINVAAGEVAVANNGICSLREAINNAESDSDTSGGDCIAGSGADTIVLTSSTYGLPDVAVSDGVYGDSGLPAVSSTITINGNGATIERDPALGAACVGAGSKFRIVYVGLAGNLTMNNLTLQNGCASFGGTGAGGALFNRGTLSLYLTTVTNNAALASGGAIHNDGTLTLTQSTISSNELANGAGGGIVNRGTMNVVQSTISGNNTPGAGGGVDTGNLASATFANATVSGNLADGNGGGIFNQGTATITNATIALNRGQQNAGAPVNSGIYSSGSATLTNSLLAQQVGTNCNSGLSGGGNNLDDDGTCPATQTATPQIGPLANNGGPTFTHALLTGSPAIDAGNDVVCGASPVNGVDQRGTSRPQFGGTSTSCDIGAFEYMVAAVAAVAAAVPALDPRYLAMLALMLFLAGGMVIRLR